MMDSIHKRWLALTKLYSNDAILVEKLWKELATAYTESSRHYHTLQHIHALLQFSEQYQNQLKYKDAIDFAVFYHDVIYKASRSDNEEQSALISNDRLMQLGVPESIITIANGFIRATKTHTVNPSPYENDLKWFLDFDLSILGAEEPVYFEYVKQIRKEFKIYPDLLYKPGRRKVLQHFLNMEFIYKTDEFRTRFEEKAKMNLRKELELLK